MEIITYTLCPHHIIVDTILCPHQQTPRGVRKRFLNADPWNGYIGIGELSRMQDPGL